MSVEVLERMFSAYRTGIEVELRVVQAWRFRDGKVLRVDVFADLESAREAGP